MPQTSAGGERSTGYYNAAVERLKRERDRTGKAWVARDSIFELLEKEELPVEDVPRTLYGVQNALWLIVALAFIQTPLLRLTHGELPIDLEFLAWIFSGIGTTSKLFLLLYLAPPISYLVLLLSARGLLSTPTREMLFRLLECIHLVLTCRSIVRSPLTPVPSFFLVTQTVANFLKMHSYYLEVRRAVDAEPDPAAKLRWLGFRPFCYFLAAPTLVYDVQGYPRTERIRRGFLLRKFGALVGLLLLIFILVTEYFMPVFQEAKDISLVEFVVRLVVPCAILFIALFFITFEIILNIFGELTRFADRLFYMDWWNAGSMDEFSRKWNRPVHDWLLRYIYKAARKAAYSHGTSAASTFLFSAIFHELVLAVTFRRARVYLLLMMMAQMPLIWAFSGRFDDRVGQRAANVFFWFGIFVGPALLSMMYAREWYIETYD